MYPDRREVPFPITDQTLPTLLDDLDERGLLDDTLVVWMGEFGRTPKINKNVSRDHWPQCYTVAAGRRRREARLRLWRSDKNGALPAADPVRPDDLAATMYYLLGIDPHTEVMGFGDRPVAITDGKPVMGVIA